MSGILSIIGIMCFCIAIAIGVVLIVLGKKSKGFTTVQAISLLIGGVCLFVSEVMSMSW